MSRKPYREIAAMLADLRESGADAPTVDWVARSLCPIMKRDNRAFDSQRFLDASGVGA